MKLTEKQRLTAITREAVERISSGHPQIKTHAKKAAAKFSPTNAEQFRKLSEIAWWLIAADAREDAMGLLDALCEVDDEFYWMFHALASSFATRAWLHSKQKNAVAARTDAKTALCWMHRDPNPKAITQNEVRRSIKRFDDWLDRAANENGTVTALHVLAHAVRVLVMYQQFAKAGDPAAKCVDSKELTTRLDSGVERLRQRIDEWY
jgi:hypothetical protein